MPPPAVSELTVSLDSETVALLCLEVRLYLSLLSWTFGDNGCTITVLGQGSGRIGSVDLCMVGVPKLV